MFAIISNLNDAADLEKVTSLKVGSYSEPLSGPNGFIIYKLNSDVKKPDYSDKDTLTAIKYYISNNKIDDITPYVDSTVALASDKAQSDFEGAAKAANATIIELKYSILP